MKYRFYLAVGVLWVFVGLFLGASSLIPMFKGGNYTNVAAKAPDTSKAVVDETPLIKGKPVHIEFPNVKISVDVAPGYYDAATKTWTLSKDKAHFATITSEPNNKTGNTFIYGHNRWQVFTALLDAKVGDQAIITTDNGHTFVYTLATMTDVQPDDTSYLETHQSPILTVQTCSGLWYENRRMLVFNLTEVR